MIAIQLQNVHKDPENVKIKGLNEILINIEGSVVVTINSVLYFQNSIPIVELAVSLNDWLRKPNGTTFKYESMDDDDPDTFDIIAEGPDSYRFHSSWQEAECPSLFSRKNIEKFVNEYTSLVKDTVYTKMGINLDEKVDL